MKEQTKRQHLSNAAQHCSTGLWGPNLPELLTCRKKTITAGKKKIQIMLNLAKAKPSSLPSFPEQTTVKKVSYERENPTVHRLSSNTNSSSDHWLGSDT